MYRILQQKLNLYLQKLGVMTNKYAITKRPTMYKNVLLRLLTLNKLCRIWKDVFAFPLLDATLNILQLFDFLCVSYLAVTENLK